MSRPSSRTGAEPAPAFHELIHAPVRLRICGLLRPVDEIEFAVLRDTLALKDANLSKNLRLLAEADLVALRKEFSPVRKDARRLTWVSLTASGRTALAAHLAALRAIAEGDPTLPG
ncbi:transcriptional regulator [Brachybacterium vulturis]|uniref:Transcriptional regulator n=1 Tax=Brachybacterium vulturis TaxID=2017484 RepID=A0A291GKZ6_9MICO|nr:transcriptional regulator [Brachybacterium vulturis]ATG50706.1 transcriptional regulator [Brachybacterium vulturis]